MSNEAKWLIGLIVACLIGGALFGWFLKRDFMREEVIKHGCAEYRVIPGTFGQTEFVWLDAK